MKIHTIQLNIEDFESGTIGMDAREKGAYISLLICLYKSSTHELPDDDKRLARMACLEVREWKKIRVVLEPKFIVYNGVWKQKRVLQEAVRYAKLSDKNRANALKRNETPLPVASQPHSQKAANISNKELVTSNSKKDKSKNAPKKQNIPDWLDGELWDEYKSHRKELKKPMSAVAESRAIKKLERWKEQGHDPTMVINTTLENNWIGFVDPDELKGKRNGNHNKSEQADAAISKALAELEQESIDSNISETELRHIPDLRQIAGSVDESD